MRETDIKKLLDMVQNGGLTVGDAVKKLKTMPYDDLGFAKLDTHRSLRQGFPEVIFGENKTQSQIKKIAETIIKRKENALITRLDDKKLSYIKKTFKKAEINKEAGTAFIKSHKIEPTGYGKILILSAGTSDIPVAQEALVTARAMGNEAEAIYDIGVAGIHRLLDKKDEIRDANVLIVVAGMEGALVSVVAGLVDRPVIAVPTSVGYGANLGGITTLLAMLNSCASGVTVVNIDNGFGAAYAASLINKKQN